MIDALRRQRSHAWPPLAIYWLYLEDFPQPQTATFLRATCSNKTSRPCLLKGTVLGAPIGESKEQSSRGLQPWLTGIIAVVVFLCLCFIGFIVNKIWCKDSGESNHPESPATEVEYANINGTQLTETLTLKDIVRSSEHPNAYENIYDITNDEPPKITITAM
ncbi:PDZK1-interacting protein 1 isoform X1 [Heptranchias perlo]|uniref:PDZK1-interacting protein 1 isoform X1 n=1 Tax=Heptranchias perlo TaxID=212740 RepID=UPI00355A185C